MTFAAIALTTNIIVLSIWSTTKRVHVSEEPLSPGQQRLLASLEELEKIPVGGGEPAVAFRPLRLSSGPVPSLDLATAAREAAASREGSEPAEETAATVAEGTGLPPPCPGVVEIATAVNAGERDVGDVLEQANARIDALNGRFNAVVTRTLQRAREDAATVAHVLAEGERPRPLSGVPLLHKDIIATRGIPTSAGSELLRGYVPGFDATVVGRLANAGTILLGKANTHEFATGTTGTVSCFGPTKNPWNDEHIAGGSSSGSAAALAAGMVAAATGTDTGGSIRIPSACCGVVGLKPTYGRVSRTGVFPFAWSLDHVGPMARRVTDVATLLTAMAGRDPFDPVSADEATPDYSAGLQDGVAGLRFAVPDSWFLELATEQVAAAVRQAGDLLETLGAQRVEVELPPELERVGPAAIAIFLAEGGSVHAVTLASNADLYDDETRAFLALAAHVSGRTYLQAQRVRAALAEGFARVFQGTDLLLTPTLPVTAPRLDARQVDLPQGRVDARAALTLFTRPFNLTGLPVLSLPCGFFEEMPIGMQIVGRPFEEATVLRAGHAYEAATEWHERRPPGL